MARKKVKLAYIADASARKATFRKRRKGLLKKVNELSTLCDVSACAVVYGPYEPQPEIWPQQPEADRVVARFKNLPKTGQFRNAEKQLNPESYARNQIDKINEQRKKLLRENRYIEINWIYNHVMAGECSMPDAYPDVVDLAWFLGEKQKEVQRKLANLNNAPPPVVHGRNTNTTAIPSNPNNNFININADVLEINGSGINGGTVTGGDMYVGVVNHHNQGGGVIINGTGGQDMLSSDAAMGALKSQPFSVDVTNPPSVVQSGDQSMVNYLEGYPNNDQMLMQLGGVSIPSYNDTTLEELAANNQMTTNNSCVQTNNQMMMQLGGVPRPSYNGGHEDIVLATNNQVMMFSNNSCVENKMHLGGSPRPSYNGGLEDIVLASNNQMMMSADNNPIYPYEQYPFNLEQFLDDYFHQ